jgi:hypothetical protein
VLGAPAADTVPMPDVPPPIGGSMHVHSIGLDTVEAEWPAEAQWCASTSVLTILADDSTSGAILLVWPADEDWEGTYAFTHPDSVGAPPRATAGVLFTPARRGFTYQSLRGRLELRRDGRYVSGEMQADLGEVGTPLMMKHAASFDRVQVTDGDAIDCAAAPAVVDTTQEPAG